MSDLAKIDSNFAVKTSLDVEGVKFYNVQDDPISIHGVFYENGKFRRMPEAVAKTVSNGVHKLHARAAGGRVRFTTNSPYVAIKVTMNYEGHSSTMTLASCAGFDLYVGKKEEYFNTFVPPVNVTDGYESVLHFPDARQRHITINFPHGGEITGLYIGLDEKATLKKAPEYKIQTPIVFYGSSITQGFCASRPGNAYVTMVCRALQADFVNLGFAGNAKAEDAIAEYVKGLDMSLFVYDYDYNAPNVEHLRNTHQKMFQAVRDAHPDTPIVILSRPKYHRNQNEDKRLKVVRKTYEDAIAAGDQNVYFIEGKALMKHAKNDGTVDNCHPNDLGFSSMASVLTKLLKTIL